MDFTLISMSKIIHTEITIQSSPERVWEVFSDFKNYPAWNPFIKSIKGEVAVGNRLVVKMELPSGTKMTFSPKVLSYEKNKELRWLGHSIFPGIFDGEHKFELILNTDGTTTFQQSEKFNGILVPLFKNVLDVHTVNGFNLMNKQLKELVEKRK